MRLLRQTLLLLTATSILAATEPLHPVGNFDALPSWPKTASVMMEELTVHPPPDAAERRQRFAQRNGPKALETLCLRLHAAMEPDALHLDTFRALVAEKAYAGALDAYRAYFFAKIRNMAPS